MSLTPESLVALLLFGVTQTGALVYFAGRVAFAVSSHGERIDKVETKTEGLVVTLAGLKAVCENEHSHCN